ncbi:MAG TPA: class I SAM-dependent methyltransferase [Chthoniobacterales bacterium]
MCLACETKINVADLDAFSGHYLEILNHGALALMISIGHRTGLFDALNTSGPCTSEQLAHAAGLNERYVREWMGAMVAGKIVECKGDTFTLSEAPSRLFTNAEGSPNIAYLSQYIGLLGEVETRIVDCFRKGGGVSYSAYPRFHDVMAEDSMQSVVEPLIEHILPLVPGLILALQNGIDVLDVGCGRGRALHLLAATFPASRFTGYDLSETAIAFAVDRADRAELRNLRFETRDLTHFHCEAPEAAYDLVTAFDAIHDQARPDNVLAGIRRSLKPTGIFLMQDIRAASNPADNRDHVLGPLLYTISCMHCMTTSLAQGGMGLGAMWGEGKAIAFLQEAGFQHIDVRVLEHDIQNNYYLAYPGN